MKKIGYKATIDLQCRDLTYEVGKTYEMKEIEMCGKGFHFCKRIEDTLRYYDLTDGLTFIEIEDLGDSINELNKTVTNKIKVLRIVPEDELDWLTKPIRYEDPNGYWYTKEYDDKGNCIKFENSDGYWNTDEFDENGNVIRYENSDGYWNTKEYDNNGNCIRYEDSDGYWYTKKYDDKGNCIKFENSDGYWYTKKYDTNGNLIRYKDSDGIMKT